eukprot:SAG31_NODE_2445_length_5681_cov_18.644930_2_plen_132_part_00
MIWTTLPSRARAPPAGHPTDSVQMVTTVLRSVATTGLSGHAGVLQRRLHGCCWRRKHIISYNSYDLIRVHGCLGQLHAYVMSSEPGVPGTNLQYDVHTVPTLNSDLMSMEHWYANLNYDFHLVHDGFRESL